MVQKTITELIAHWSKVFDLPIKKELGFPDNKRVDLALKFIVGNYQSYDGIWNRSTRNH
jgi:hypothetical protein